jgi:thiamine biosynthesis lipoprotein ApbE
VTNRVQVTLIGKDGAAVDALSTALCVLGERAGKRLAAEFNCKPLFLHPGD